MVVPERYELLSEVGAGSFGVVYRARDKHDGSEVALKVLHRCEPATEGRFLREAVLLANLQHPSVVRYIDHGRTVAGQSYLAMEWLEGETLRDRLRCGLLSARETWTVLRCLVGALFAAEQKGIVHRDLKPANVLLVGGDAARAKLLDFGLARRGDESLALTQLGQAVGSPLYMSPEQARGDQILHSSSDVFSLGSVGYECLAGSAPFHGPSMLATLAKICLEEPERLENAAPGTPSRIADLIHAMLHKEPAQRPTYAALMQLLQSDDIDNFPAAPARRTSMRVDVASSMLGQSVNIRAQQRVVCALFIGGSDDEANSLEEELRALFIRCGARCEQLREGSRILLFDQRTTPAEQAHAAARCALAVLSMLPDVPMALITGRSQLEGARRTGDMFGRGALQLAKTRVGTLSVDKTTAALLADRFDLHEDGDLTELTGERTLADTPRTLLGKITPFVGRDRELSRLQSIVDEAIEESVARAVLVTAPAGAGKSRLRYELLRRLNASTHGCLIIQARGDSVRAGLPLSTLATGLRAYADLDIENEPLQVSQAKLTKRVRSVLPSDRAPLVAAMLGELCGVSFQDPFCPELSAIRREPQLMADRMLAGFAEWLEAESSRQPVLFCIEDLHWSDATSVRYLDTALRNASARPVVILAFARPEARDVFPTLWSERDLVEIRLPKLNARHAERLLEEVSRARLDPAMSMQLIERADGNPFFLEELVRSVGEKNDLRELPDSILGIVQTRLDALGEEAKLVLRAGSTFGQSFSDEGLKALLDVEAEHMDLGGWLKLLCDRELLFKRGTAAEPEYVFRHALTRDAAYALLADDARIQCHCAAAQWLLQRGSREAGLLASHFEKGGLLAEAADWYRKAALHALESDSLKDVLSAGERAVACGAHGASLGEVSAVVAEALAFSGAQEQAAQWARRAMEALEEGHAAWWRAVQVLTIAELNTEPTRARTLMETMLRKTPEAPNTSSHLIALCIVANASFVLSEGAYGQRLLEATGGDAGRTEPRELTALYSAYAMRSAVEGDMSGAVRHQLHALEILRSLGARVEIADSLSLVGFAMGELGDLDAAERNLTELCALAGQLGMQHTLFNTQQNLGMVQTRLGRHDDARRTLLQSAQGFAQLGQRREQAFSESYLVLATRALGNLAGAEEHAVRALALSEGDLRSSAVALAVAALVDLDAGKLERARERAQQAFSIHREHGLFEHGNLLRVARIESLRKSDDHQGARAAAQEARAWLLEQAAKIDDLTLRHQFLTRVPENARISALASGDAKG